MFLNRVTVFRCSHVTPNQTDTGSIQTIVGGRMRSPTTLVAVLRGDDDDDGDDADGGDDADDDDDCCCRLDFRHCC